MESPKISLGDSWQKAFDHFVEIGFLEGSPDNGDTVKVFFSQLENLNITIPKVAIWRMIDRDDDIKDKYYLLKWEGYLMILYLDGSSEICAYPGPVKYKPTSRHDLLSYMEKNMKVVV